MSRIEDLISTIHPYDSLPGHERARLAGVITRRHYGPDEQIFHHGDRLSGLFLIESGLVRVTDADGRLISELRSGNSFGERGLLRDGRAVTSAMALEPTSVLFLPADELNALIAGFPAFARFFVRSGPANRRSDELSALKVGDLVARAPLSCGPDTPVIDAAKAMRAAHASSIAIVDQGRLVGLATIRDLSNRIIAEGRDIATPIRQIMTPDPVTLSPDDLGYDVLNIMLERRIGHLPVVEGGRFVGMVSQTDLMRVQAMTALALIHDIGGADSPEALARDTARIPEMLVRMVDGHYRHDVITRRITDIADTVTRRLLHLAEAQLGPPPGPWLWAACGSQGRQEQTGQTDQDNCLILGDDCDPDHPWFEDLARFVCDGLNACGYVYCPGDMMATNPRWRQPRRVWHGYFRRWIDRPDPEAQMLASVMFDMRAICGDASLLSGLQADTLKLASDSSIFLAHMISNALSHRPPLGLFGSLTTIRSGRHGNHIDMKMSGVVPVTDLARIYALQGRLEAVNTRARLVDAQPAGLMTERGGLDLIAAYDLIQTLRLDNQAAQIRSGQAPDNYLHPDEIPTLERSHLRDAFVVVRTMQSALGARKGLPI